MRCAAFAGVLAVVLFGTASPRVAADEALQRLLYVASPDAAGGRGGKGIYVFAIDKGHKLVRTIDLPLKGLRGVCGSAGMGRLWISHGDTNVLCLDLATDKILWEKTYERKDGCDRLSCTPDGKKIYVPNGTWSSTGEWKVLSGETGAELGRFRPHKSGGGHNSIVSLDGTRLFCASKNNNFLTVVDTAADKVLREIGPVGGGIHPFSVNAAGTLCFLNTGRAGVGFEVGDIATGKIIHEVKVPGFESQKRLCHGIGLSPDEKEIWLNDQGQMHIFDVGGAVPRFVETVTLTAPGHGWTTFSIDGRFAYPDSGDVFDGRSHKVDAKLTDRVDGGKGVASSKMIEVHFQAGKVVRIGDQNGLGRKPAAVPAKEIRDAVQRSLPLIEKGNTGHLEKRSCFACHHQAVPLLALSTARSRGLAIDEALFQKNLRAIAGFLDKNRDNYRKGQGQGGQVDTAGYALWTLQLGRWEPDHTTAAVAEYLLRRDAKQDHWPTTSDRPPSEVSPFTTTYVALRGLEAYATDEQHDRVTERFEQVRGWLGKTTALDTEDRVFRLRALKLARADAAAVQAAADDLLKTQRDDGGWNQKAAMDSDAYATGSALVALHEVAGLATGAPAYRRGVKFLLQTQRADGSWHVASRSKPFQLYYESGFPHGKDQFISMAASSWAATALALCLPLKQESVPSELQSLSIEPGEVHLHGSNRQQQLLITGTTPAGKPIDVTHLCAVSSSDDAIVSVRGSRVQGVRDGNAKIEARLGKWTAAVSVSVRDFATYPPVHFANDVAPLFSKLGCNSGGCHGKASGQNGFRLSVFGFDPLADYDALVKEARGRRIFPAAPAQSLLLLKPTGTIAHGGGRRIEVGAPDYVVLYEWLEQGAPIGSTNAPRLAGLRVSPAERMLGLKADQQILATAVFSDGSQRDVTAAASYTSNAGHVAAVDGGGRVHTGSVPGEAAITVQYMGQVAVVRFQVPRPGAPNPYPALTVNNKIDVYAWAKLKTMGILPSELAGDTVFLRRVYLDALGTLPRPDEVRAFLADPDPKKREQWIDRILERPEYADYSALRWADVLQVNRDKLGDRGAFEMHRWLRTQMAGNRPYDQWVRELIAATGSSARVGPVNFYRASATAEELTRSVSQAFLGIRLECAQCHHHPFEKWAQEDFYALAGFFNGLQRKKTSGDDEVMVHPGYRAMTMPMTSRLVPAHPPAGPVLPEKFDGDPRPFLAAWMTKADNPWFARLAVNRLWKHYLGRGLVEPEDDLRSTNPPTNEALLDYLAQTLIEKKYDLKAVTRLVLNSRVYQLSSVPNATNGDDEQHYAHYRVKRLPAEVLLDAISAVTQSPESFPGRPRGTRAIELWDNRMPSYFLDIFGRSERLSPCECGRSSEPTMAQCLHLMNAPEIERKIADPAGRVARLLTEKKSQSEIVDDLCLAALGRPAREKERRVAADLFRAGASREAAQDFMWALLNSHEFLFVR